MSDDFKKYDGGKSRVDLLDPRFMLMLGHVLRFGATVKGYGEDNWKQCTDTKRYFAAMLRHSFEAMEHGAEALDEESGLPILAHAAINAMFAYCLARDAKEKGGK